MHPRPDSAPAASPRPSAALTLPQRRRRETASRLVRVARAWTAERGSNGFTVEELCEHVGVSRRTFFNYFAKKEYAILGIRAWQEGREELVQRFLDSDGPLLDALVELALDRWESLGVDAGEHAQLRQVLQSEPSLFGHLVDFGNSVLQADTELIERREQLLPGDLRATTAVLLVRELLLSAVDPMGDGESEDIRERVARRMAAARSLFTEHG